MHNGLIRDFPRVKPDLAFAVDPELYPAIEGATDSELFFYLALTFGLEDDPVGAVEKAVGLIEDVGREHGVDNAVDLAVATTDGQGMWAFRYASDGDARSLYISAEVETLRAQFPDNPIFEAVSENTRLVVSEPQGSLAGIWHEFPQASSCSIRGGASETRPLTPRNPA